MIECCSTCNKYMKLEKADYSDKGCKHSDYDGFACLAFVDEGIVVHMVGVNPDNGFCEAYSGKTYDKKTMKVPTAQPEIIRCKDCKHYNAGYECLIEGYGIERNKNWYCADAERRAEKEEVTA